MKVFLWFSLHYMIISFVFWLGCTCCYVEVLHTIFFSIFFLTKRYGFFPHHKTWGRSILPALGVHDKLTAAFPAGYNANIPTGQMLVIKIFCLMKQVLFTSCQRTLLKAMYRRKALWGALLTNLVLFLTGKMFMRSYISNSCWNYVFSYNEVFSLLTAIHWISGCQTKHSPGYQPFVRLLNTEKEKYTEPYHMPTAEGSL